MTDKKTRGDGPVSVTYIDAEGKSHKRVPDKVVGVTVADKGGKTKTFKLADLSPAMINSLAASGLGKRIDIYVRNTVKNDESADVVGTATHMYDLIKSGSLYTRGEGTVGPKFDIEKWVDVMSHAAELQKQPLNEKKQNSLRALLMGLHGRERQAQILKWQKNPFVKVSLANYQVKEAKEKAKSGGAESVADMF